MAKTRKSPASKFSFEQWAELRKKILEGDSCLAREAVELGTDLLYLKRAGNRFYFDQDYEHFDDWLKVIRISSPRDEVFLRNRMEEGVISSCDLDHLIYFLKEKLRNPETDEKRAVRDLLSRDSGVTQRIRDINSDEWLIEMRTQTFWKAWTRLETAQKSDNPEELRLATSFYFKCKKELLAAEGALTYDKSHLEMIDQPKLEEAQDAYIKACKETGSIRAELAKAYEVMQVMGQERKKAKKRRAQIKKNKRKKIQRRMEKKKRRN